MRHGDENVNVLIVGATGFLGGGALRALRWRGHGVTGIARGDAARRRLEAAGCTAVAGDVDQPDQLARAASAADAVVYAVQLNQPDAEEVESRALRALAGALEGSEKALLYTSGVWFYGATGDRIADESTPANPPPTVVARPRLEKIVLDSATRGVRAIVVRPGDVFGEGRGLPALFVESARSSGAARTFGDGRNRWPVIHVDDLGALYALALENAAAGDVYNATDDTSFTQLEIARAASRGAGRNGETTVWPLDEAAATMGEWVRNLALDQRVTSARARARLQWSPKAPTILEDLERGSYALQPS
jgi:nucleoside-diphosphate-sugar epimerase